MTPVYAFKVLYQLQLHLTILDVALILNEAPILDKAPILDLYVFKVL
jgi:hypothetical protein